ncbi:MAG: hypothetical protein FJW31_04370 [Acidobacteria bacterium]|nr:hypothetical protein [Acidobacteriota bacterium]
MPYLLFCFAAVFPFTAAWAQSAAGGVDGSLLQLLRSEPSAPVSPWIELAKLTLAAVVGLAVTATHRYCQGDKVPSRSLLQASVLLSVSGALMMIIIGNSTARALGIAGGASIIRFRTPVDDPKDAIILFLLMGLGMSAGLGSFAVCALGTVFLCLFLVALNQFGEGKPRAVQLEVVASSPEFPMEHVGQVLRHEGESFEVIKMTKGNEATAKFLVKLPASVSLTSVSGMLMAEGKAGVKSVSWEQKKADQ